MKNVEKFKEVLAKYSVNVLGYNLEKCWELQEELIKMYEELEEPQEKPVIKEWESLSKEEKEFVLRVSKNEGTKYGAEPYCDYANNINLWENPEKLGFIQSLGSYKFVVTEKYKEIENVLKGE